MPQACKGRKKHRFNFEMHDDVRDCLTRLIAKLRADSGTEVLRRTMMACERMVDHLGDDGEIILRKKKRKGGTEDKEVILVI